MQQTVNVGTSENAGDGDKLRNAFIKVNANESELYSKSVVVDTLAEFEASLLVGANIYLNNNTFTLTSPARILVAGTEIRGPGKLIYPHSTTARYVVSVEAPNVNILDCEITTNYSLPSAGPMIEDIGILVSVATNVNGLRIDNCNIHNVATPIYRNGFGAATPYASRIRITNNNIYSFCNYGVYVNWNSSGLLVDNNTVKGRNPGETHFVSGNGVWIGNNAQYAKVVNNNVSAVGRNGIECWNDPANASGNESIKILNNVVEGLFTNTITGDGGIGISALGNGCITIMGNTVKNIFGLGIEVLNDLGNKGDFVVVGNTVEDLLSVPAQNYNPIAMSLNSITSACLVSNNVFGKVSVLSGQFNLTPMGIQIIGGAGAAHPELPVAGSGILVSNNSFTDAGTRMIYLNGNGTDKYNVIELSNNTFRATPNRPTGNYFPAIYIQNLKSGVAVMKNNTYWRSASDYNGSFDVAGSGNVYFSASASDAPATGNISLAGSNLSLAYYP